MPDLKPITVPSRFTNLKDGKRVRVIAANTETERITTYELNGQGDPAIIWQWPWNEFWTCHVEEPPA